MTTSTVTRRHWLLTVSALCTAQALPVRAAGNITPPPLDAFGRLPAVSDIALSPKGDRIAMIMRKGDERVLFDYNIVTGAVSTMPIGTVKVDDLIWIDETYLLITTHETLTFGRKVDFYQNIIIDPGLKQQPKGLFREPVLSNGTPNTIEIDGRKHLIYLDQGNLILQDPATRKTRHLRTGLPHYAFLISDTGDLVAGYDYDLDRSKWILAYPDGKGWKTVFERKGRLELPSVAGMSRDGRSVILFLQDDNRPHGYYEVRSDGSIGEQLNPDHLNSDLIFHPRTRRLAGFANYTTWVDYVFEDADLKELSDTVSAALKGRRFSFSAFAEDPQKCLVRTEGDKDAGTVFYIDLSTGTVAQIGRTYPDIPEAWLAPKKPILYKAQDGLEIDAYLTLPPEPALNGRAAKNLPLIVMPHGGPESADDMGFDYMAQAAASRGYAVLQPNFRGSSNKGQSFAAKGYGEWGRKMQTDLSDGIRHLATQGTIDPARVAICGSSYGGYAALAGAAYDKGIYRCAVAVAGVSDLPLMMKETLRENYNYEFGSVLYVRRMLGDEAQWPVYSPARNAEKIDIPVLLIHGTHDSVVSIEHSQKMQAALQKAGKPVEFITLEGEGHHMQDEASRITKLKAALAFIEKHNPA